MSWTATRTTKGKNIHKSISNPAKISIPYRQRNTRKIVRQIMTERGITWRLEQDLNRSYFYAKNKKKGEHMEEQETAVAIAEIKKEIGSLKHRMDSAEEVVNVVHQLAQEMVGLTKEVGFMNKTLVQLTAKVASLEEKPAKRWDTLVSALLGVAAGAVGAMIFK